jgi:heme exporter protein D
LTDYLAMGGYAAYVWSAFGIALLLLVGLFVQSRQSARRCEDELAQLRAEVRPHRARVARPMRPRRDIDPVEPGMREGS